MDCRITLDIFLDCLFDQEYTKLIIEGEPTETELKEAWQKIYLEYLTLMNDNSFNHVFELTTQIQATNAQIVLVNGIIYQLTKGYWKEGVEMLNGIGIPIVINEGDPIFPKIKTIEGYAKRWIVDVQIKEKELEGLQQRKAKEVGRYSFYESLSAISRHEGYGVLATQIPVAQYCKIIKRIELEYVNSQLQNA